MSDHLYSINEQIETPTRGPQQTFILMEKWNIGMGNSTDVGKPILHTNDLWMQILKIFKIDKTRTLQHVRQVKTSYSHTVDDQLKSWYQLPSQQPTTSQ